MIDGSRLLHRIDRLAAVSSGGPGVTRLAYSPEDGRGRALVSEWLAAAGLAVTVDAAGNLRGWRAGTEPGLPAIAVGSHLDTVVEAGPLDGAYGVLAAVEVAAAVGPLRHPLLVLGISNEEGARGTPGMVGSHALAGRPLPLGVPDDEGVTLAARLGATDLATAALDGRLACFLELHIEQGPVLTDSGTEIGIVTAITGRRNLDIAITGAPRHAGTTPMAARRDALAAGARMILAVEALAAGGAVRVATVGRLTGSPGVRNVVAGQATLCVDLRDGDPVVLAAAVEQVRALAAGVAETTGCELHVLAGPSVEPVGMDERLRACFADAAASLGLRTTTLPSGAGHDAQVLAGITPVGMCFIPSVDGISHAPEESSTDADLVNGATTLLAAVRLADERLDPAPREP